ncbi:hypothetical protein V8C34DRAFT_297577 [Trichoderma compactum]
MPSRRAVWLSGLDSRMHVLAFQLITPSFKDIYSPKPTMSTSVSSILPTLIPNTMSEYSRNWVTLLGGSTMGSYVIKPHRHGCLEAASTQGQAGSVPGAGSNERSSPQQSPRGNSDDGPSRAERPFALENWLSETPKDEPFNALASARAPASEPAVGTPSATPLDGSSRL